VFCFVGVVKQVHPTSSAVLRCRSVFYDSVLWRYRKHDSDRSRILYLNGIFTVDSRRFEVSSRNSTPGVFDLRIKNVQFSDAGVYRCTENDGHYPGEVRYVLNVTGA